MKPPLLALLAAVAVLALSAGALTRDVSPAHAAFVGDVNCDADVNPDDAVASLVGLSNSTPLGGCSGTADFDCDTDSDIADILRILRYSAGFDDAPVGDCPTIGSVTPNTTTEQLASDLAARLHSPYEGSRYRALLHVFERIGFGVYETEGAPVLLGEEREAGDLYFYDFELRMMATSMARGDEYTLGDVAGVLLDMGITEAGGGDITAEAMRSRLLDGVDAALADPDAPGSFLALLVRDLGLTHDPPYNLQTDVAVADIRLDTVQEFLMVADVGAYFVYESGPVDVTQSQLVEQSSGILRSQPSGIDTDCERWGKDVKHLWGVGVFIVGLTAAGPVAVLAAEVIDGIHGMVLAYSVLVSRIDTQTFTHYGHEQPGNPVNFELLVEMRDDLGEIVTKCGWLAGVEFPPKGPIEGVDILWSGQGSLQRNGIVTCPASTCEKTAANGIARLHFEPDQEQQPYGTGIEHRYNDVLVGNALYLSKHNNILGKVNERLTPKEVEFDWGVEWHAPSCVTNGSPFGGTSPQGSLPTATIPPELAALPCTWSGTVNGSMQRACCGDIPFITEDGTNSSTIHFGNPTWDGFQTVTYETTGGEFTWHSTGTLDQYPDPCDFDQDGTEDIQGSLWIMNEGAQLTYNAGVSSTDQERQLECPPEDGQPIIENITAIETCSLHQTNVTDGSSIKGTCEQEVITGYHEQFNWSFDAGPCIPSPEPVCNASTR